MKLLNTSYIEIKKSKFYGYLYELDSIEDVKIILNNLKEENKGYRPMLIILIIQQANQMIKNQETFQYHF